MKTLSNKLVQEELRCWQQLNPNFQPMAGLLDLLLNFTAEELPPADASECEQDGVMLSRIPLVVPNEQLAQRWSEVIEACSTFVALVGKTPEQLQELPIEWLQGYLMKLPSNPMEVAGELADRTGITVDAASFMLLHTMGPFYQTYARQFGPEDTAQWSQGQCPTCGARPHYGLLDKDTSARLLECWLCATRWRYPRLQCPHCENPRQEALGFFMVDDDEKIRVYYCSQCSSYLKIVDGGILEREVHLGIINLATLTHDLAAIREGFKPGSGLNLIGSDSV